MFKLTDKIYINVKNQFFGRLSVLHLKNSWDEACGKVLYAKQSSEIDLEIPKNEVKDFYNSHLQSGTGIIYDEKPFKVRLIPNKIYYWCACGQSKTQPFCDGSHKSPYLKIKLRPVRLEVSKEKDYWLCNCKQTNNRPFCDGAHKQLDVQKK